MDARIVVQGTDELAVTSTGVIPADEGGYHAAASLQDDITTARQEIAALSRSLNQIQDERAESFQRLDAAVGGTGLAPYQPEIDLVIEARIKALRAQHRAAVGLVDYIKPALPVLKTMLTVAGLQAGADKAAEMIAAIDALTPASPDPAPVGEAPGPFPTAGLWRCEDCGEAPDGALHDSRWRWNGTRWEHHHGYPVGHVAARYFGPDEHLNPATCRAQGHGRVSCDRCGAELVDVASVRAWEER